MLEHGSLLMIPLNEYKLSQLLVQLVEQTLKERDMLTDIFLDYGDIGLGSEIKDLLDLVERGHILPLIDLVYHV